MSAAENLDTMTQLGVLLMEPQVPEDAEHDVPPADPRLLDGWFNYQLTKLAEIAAEQQRNRETVAAIVKQWTDWQNEENAVLERKADWIRHRIREHAIAYDFAGKRSRRLPAGEFGQRTQPAKIDITDKAAAIAFSKAKDIPVRTVPAKEEPDANALKVYHESTGIVPDGTSITPKRDEFYAKPKAGK